MSSASAHSTGLAMENEGKEVPLDQPPPWTEDKIKVFPVVSDCSFPPLHVILYLLILRGLRTWKNPATGALHFQVHPYVVQELLIGPLSEGAQTRRRTLPRRGAPHRPEQSSA